MTTHPPMVPLIHATPAPIAPAALAFAQQFPQEHPWNLLDDRLLNDAAAAGRMTPSLQARTRSLIDHALDGEATGTPPTCSLHGHSATHTCAHRCPSVLSCDQAPLDRLAFCALSARSSDRSTQSSPLPSPRLRSHLHRTLRRPPAGCHQPPRPRGAHGGGGRGPPCARRLGRRGSRRPHREMCDVIVVGHFWMCTAAAAAAAVGIPA